MSARARSPISMFAVCAVTAACCTVASALPSLTPHPHTFVQWSENGLTGAGVNHQHLLQDVAGTGISLYIPNGNAQDETPGSPTDSGAPNMGSLPISPSPFFDAYSTWDQAGNQALYRNGANQVSFGHGFIRAWVPYAFAGTVPGTAQTDFNAAMSEWRLLSRTQFLVREPVVAPGRLVLGNWMGPGAIEDANFNGALNGAEDGNINGQLDGFGVTWNASAGALGAWATGGANYTTTHFQNFDNAMAGGAVQGVQNGNGTAAWLFGNGAAANNGQVSFRTIARHEIGHIYGLAHVDTPSVNILNLGNSIMRADIAFNSALGGGTRPGQQFIDPGSADGVAALYTQTLKRDANAYYRMAPHGSNITVSTSLVAWHSTDNNTIAAPNVTLAGYAPAFNEVTGQDIDIFDIDMDITIGADTHQFFVNVSGSNTAPSFSTFDLLWHPDYEVIEVYVNAINPASISMQVLGGHTPGNATTMLGSGSLLNNAVFALSQIGDPLYSPLPNGHSYNTMLMDVGDIDVVLGIPEPGFCVWAVLGCALAMRGRRGPR